MIGKLPPDALDTVLDRLGAESDALTQGPAYGEDAAAIDLGDEYLVVSADPLSLAAERVGTLGVHVACNDVAASGADPEWLSVVVFVPDDDPEVLDTVTRQLDEAASELGVTIVGGHTEYSAELSRPTLSLTCLGRTDRFVPTGGAEPGDRILITKGAGIEATAILATDFREALLDRGVDEATVEEAATYFADVSVVPEASILREHATAMHDPTEGGLVDGLLEVAVASGVEIEVEREAIPLREPTRELCEAMDVDPLACFGSGALVAAVPEDAVGTALDDLEEAGIEAADIGTVVEGGGRVRLGEAMFEEPVRDELYALWE